MLTKFSYHCILLGILILFAFSVLDSTDKIPISRFSATLFKGASLCFVTTGFILIWGILFKQKIFKDGPGCSASWLTFYIALFFSVLSVLLMLSHLFSFEIINHSFGTIISAITVLLFVLILPIMSIHIESDFGQWKTGRIRIHESVIGTICIITGILFIYCGNSEDHLGLLALTSGAFLFGRDHVDVLNHRFIERVYVDESGDDVNNNVN